MIRSFFRLHSVPQGVQSRRSDIKAVVAAGGEDKHPWLAVDATQSFKSVVTASHEKILLGWRRVGFGQDHFCAFSVIPMRGETTLQAARREMKAAVGIEPTDLFPIGKLLIVTEGCPEAREEEILLAPCWTGKATQTQTTIPGVFRIRSYPRLPSKSPSFSCEKLSDVSPPESNDSRLSLDSLPSFHPIPPPKSMWQRVMDALREALSRSRPLPPPDLALPWHCMQPDDRVWYPLLASGKHFVGRVDYAVPKEGETVGEMRRWWFAELNSS